MGYQGHIPIPMDGRPDNLEPMPRHAETFPNGVYAAVWKRSGSEVHYLALQDQGETEPRWFYLEPVLTISTTPAAGPTVTVRTGGHPRWN